MKLFVGSLIAAASLAAAGCCSTQSGQAVNPFMNSTLPPAGAVVQPPPAGSVMAAPLVPPTTTPPPGGQYSPSTFQFQGSAIERRRRWDRPTGGLTADSRSPVDRRDEDDGDFEESGGEADSEEPLIVLAAQAPDETEAQFAPPLPPRTVVRVLSPPQTTLAVAEEPLPTPAEEPAVQQAGYQSDPTDDHRVAPAVHEVAVAVAEPPGRFSHADDYSLLEGRLEFSQKAKQWKLRYIPLDGTSDAYGGSVVLASPTAIDQYREGDFVVVRGKLGSGPTQTRTFAPPYDVATIAGQ